VKRCNVTGMHSQELSVSVWDISALYHSRVLILNKNFPVAHLNFFMHNSLADKVGRIHS
jgi:hypothetical protein